MIDPISSDDIQFHYSEVCDICFAFIPQNYSMQPHLDWHKSLKED
jgi:hypothetical protein